MCCIAHTMQDRNSLSLPIIKQTYTGSKETSPEAQTMKKNIHVQLFRRQLARQEGTKERRQVNPRRFNALDKSYEPVPSSDLSLPNLETKRLQRLDAIISFLPSIQPKFDTGTNCNRNPISRREKKSEPWTAQRRREKAEKLHLFHNNRARTLGRTNQRSKISPQRLLALR